MVIFASVCPVVRGKCMCAKNENTHKNCLENAATLLL